MSDKTTSYSLSGFRMQMIVKSLTEHIFIPKISYDNMSYLHVGQIFKCLEYDFGDISKFRDFKLWL